MITILKELPDWMMGTMLAGAGWFSVSYTVLAERALQQQVSEEIIPQCTLQLEGEQDIAVRETLSRLQEKARYARETTIDRLKRRRANLNQQLNKIQAARLVYDQYNRTGLGEVLRSTGMMPAMPALPATGPIHAELKSIRTEIARLAIPDTITIPKVPAQKLASACLCAASDVVAGKKTATAISMASFRVINPDALLSLKSDVTDALNLSHCDARPWAKDGWAAASLETGA